MDGLTLTSAAGASMHILCVGAHCDDIEIGCGGTLRMLQAALSECRIDWVVLCGTPERSQEVRDSMRQLLQPSCVGQLLFGQFSDGRLPSEYASVKNFFESLVASRTPDLIFCHERDDRHQDHRVVNEMVWATFRNHLILEYEIPKWDGGLGQPNFYVPLEQRDVDEKVRTLLSCYESQRAKDWFSADTFLAIMRLRGLECRSPSGFAEAFHGRKIRVRCS